MCNVIGYELKNQTGYVDEMPLSVSIVFTAKARSSCIVDLTHLKFKSLPS